MSENEEEPALYKLCKYYLVEFIHRGRRRKTEHVDIVPSNWLTFDIKSKRPITKFLSQPYTDESILMLHSLVKSCSEPPEDWPVFPVSVKGKTDSYNEAMNKLDQLREKPHVLTLESEDSCSTVQMKINDALRQRDFQKQADKVKQQISAELSNSDSSKESENEETHTVKKRKMMKKKSNYSHSYSAGVENEIRDSMIKDSHTVPISSITSTLSQIRSVAQINNTAESDKSLVSAVKPSTQTTKSVNMSDICSTSNPNYSADQGIDFLDDSSILQQDSLDPNNCTTKEVTSETVVTLDVPLVHVSTFENLIIEKLDKILEEIKNLETKQNEQKSELQELQRQLSETKTYLVDKKLINKSNTSIDFNQKYNLIIPFDDMQQFKSFDQSLSTNKFLKCDVCLELNRFIEKDCSISKSFAGMFRRFMTKNLGQMFTAVRQAREQETNKDIFKTTELCTCMFGIITAARSNNNIITNEKELITGLSAVVCNIKKWNT